MNVQAKSCLQYWQQHGCPCHSQDLSLGGRLFELAQILGVPSCHCLSVPLHKPQCFCRGLLADQQGCYLCSTGHHALLC